jgi:hypothetical protein
MMTCNSSDSEKKASKFEPSSAWQEALKMCAYGFTLTPVKGKEAFLLEWPKKGRSGKTGVREWAKIYPQSNYGVLCNRIFVLEMDLNDADLDQELDRMHEILGPFEIGFMVKTGRPGKTGGYHLYCDAKGREIPTQDLTDLTQIRGVNHYVVGPGSVHPDTGAIYTPVEDHDDPSLLTKLSDETLDKLAAKRDADTSDQSTVRMFDLGDGAEVLKLEHPPCIRRLIERGAPKDQEYYQANHTIARYVVSSNLTDADGAALAAEIARHTIGHKTRKDEFDRVHNFRSCLSSARSNIDANQFACSYVWGSQELCADNLCDGCRYHSDATAEKMAPGVRIDALRIMRHDDPFEFIFNEYKKKHVSDEEMGKVLIIGKAVQNVLNANGIQPKANGASGKGKTHGKSAAVFLFPPEYVFKGSLSDKALFRHGLRPMTTLFLDDATLSEPLEELGRRAMTDFQERTEHHTLDAKNEPVTYYLPERLMFLFTRVDDTLDEQTVNRMVDVTVDESKEVDEKAHEMTAKNAIEAAPTYPLTFETMVCREIYRILHEEIGPFYVSIPFADKIQWPHKENRRNFGIFLDFIRGLAALRCMQRDQRDGVIFANRDDFDGAAALYRKLNKTQTTKLNDRQLLIVQAIHDNRGSATLNELTTRLKDQGLKYYTIYKIIHGRNGKPGLLGRIPGMTCERTHKTTSETTKSDEGSTTETESRSENVYSLPNDFRLLEAYDEGEIALPEGAEDVDLSAIPLSHRLEPLTDLTGVGQVLTPQSVKTEVAGDSIKDELETELDIFTTTLHTNTHTSTENPQRVAPEVRQICNSGVIGCKEKNSLTSGGVSPESVKPVKSVEVVIEEGRNEPKKANEGHSVKKSFDESAVKRLSKRADFDTLDSGNGKSDDSFKRHFWTELMSFKRAELRKQRGYNTPDEVIAHVCVEVATNHRIFLDDVRAAWERLANHPDLVQELDAIMNDETGGTI